MFLGTIESTASRWCGRRLVLLLAMMALASTMSVNVATAQFGSGFTGADGPLDFTGTPAGTVVDFDPALDGDGDGIYQFTIVTIPVDVTIRFRADTVGALRSPLSSKLASSASAVSNRLLGSTARHRSTVDLNHSGTPPPAVRGHSTRFDCRSSSPEIVPDRLCGKRRANKW